MPVIASVMCRRRGGSRDNDVWYARAIVSVADLIAEVRRAGAELSLHGDQLRVRAPRGALSSELKQRLQADRDALIAAMSGSLGAASVLEPIPASPADEPAPLSAGQQRLWFLDRLQPGTPLLNLPVTLRLRGPLDVEVLRWTIAELGRRHDALRTAIVTCDGEPCQVVRPTMLELGFADFSGLDAAERLPALMARRDEEVRRAFAPEEPPLIRFLLLCAAPDDHYLVFVASHLIFDGTSHDIVFRELKLLYEARALGTALPPPPALRLADFVRWQLAERAKSDEATELRALAKRLHGMPATLDLPIDTTRPAEPTGQGARYALPLDRELVSALRRVAGNYGATLNMLVLASVELLLARFSGQEDFGLGVPSKGRNRPESEAVIGMFVNTLVLRTDVPMGGRFCDLLARVKETSLEALAHEDVPFEALVRALRPARERGRTPLFQVMYSYYEASARDHRIHDLELEEIPTHAGTSPYDLTFWLLDHGATALAEVEANSDVFSEATGRHLCNAWRKLLETVVEDAELSIDSPRFEVPPVPVQAVQSREHVAPHDSIERSLVRIWSEALGVATVGIDDDFFELGGESLAAVRIFDEIERVHRVELPLSVLFSCRTVSRLAAHLRGDAGVSRTALWNTVVPIRTRGSLPAVFCVAGLGGNPLHLCHLSDALGDSQPFYGLQHRGVDGRRTPHQSIEAMAEEFLSDVRKVQPTGPYYLAGYRSAGYAAYELARRLRALGERVGLLMLLDTRSPRAARQTVKQLVGRHLAELAHPSGLAERLAGRADTWMSRARSTVGARLANRDPFRYRNEAVLHAGTDAARHFCPQPYDGDVLLFTNERGASGRDESDSWREYVRGSLEIVRLGFPDGDPIGKQTAGTTAAAMRRAIDLVRVT